MDVDLSGPLLLDGAIATNLFKTQSPPQNICQEQWILEHPEKLLELQKKFRKVGSQILCTPTFGASASRLARFGLEEKEEEYNRRLVELTRQAADGAWVAGGMSASGVSLEPFGDVSFTEMIEIYRRQARILLDAGADLLLVETLTSISEARAAAIALRKFHRPFMITMTVDEDGETPFGGTALNALIILQELGVSAFGLNCSYGTENIEEIIRQMRPYAKIPLIAKPSANRYDQEKDCLVPLTPEQMGQQMSRILDAGAMLVGGCCGTTPEHLEEIRRVLEHHVFPKEPPKSSEEIGDIVLADANELYNLYCDQIECSSPVSCSVDMIDELLELEEENCDVIVIKIDSLDDARDFARNAHIPKLPVCFYSHDETALRLALLLYNGRALVDSRSAIEPEKLQEIAQKYGAIIY